LQGARAVNENVMFLLKRFKTISDKYRNRSKRYGSFKFNLIAAIYSIKGLVSDSAAIYVSGSAPIYNMELWNRVLRLFITWN